MAIIDENCARRFWPSYPAGQDPIGQYLLTGGVDPHPTQIVGIAAHVHQNLENTAWPETVYSVVQRTREVGIRRALGAQRGDIVRLVAGQGLWLALTGVAFGVTAAAALTRVMQSLLFGVSATDPAVFLTVAFLFLLVTLVAGYFPARRATRIDPMVALRLD